jgi:hypothetical protein
LSTTLQKISQVTRITYSSHSAAIAPRIMPAAQAQSPPTDK